MNEVGFRRPPSRSGLSIGGAGWIDPRSGQPFEDLPGGWRTRMPLCPSCGEVIGTTRRRHRYAWNRSPATVKAVECEDCGAELCERCCAWMKTAEVIGTYRASTEGGARIKRPRYRYAALCQICRSKRIQAQQEARDSAQFQCPECGYVGRRDSFGMGRTLDHREYVKTCPQCGFAWEPAIMGLLSGPEQAQIRPVLLRSH